MYRVNLSGSLSPHLFKTEEIPGTHVKNEARRCVVVQRYLSQLLWTQEQHEHGSVSTRQGSGDQSRAS